MHRYLIAGVLMFAAGPALASGCELLVKSNDAMQFDVKEITVPKNCKRFTVKLEHTGKMPKAAMGHNWVLTEDTDFQAVATASAAAGLAREYVLDDPRIIAHTGLIGGGESTAVTFDVARLAAARNYIFFCSFPGHWAVMKGTLRLGA